MSKFFVLLLPLFLFASDNLSSTIIFFDVNFSMSEYDELKKIAKRQGKKLITIPNVSEEDRKKMRSDWNHLQKFDPNSDQGYKESVKFNKKYNNLISINQNKDFDKISEELKSSPAVSDIVISGHSMGENFNGLSGQLEYLDLVDFLDKHPDVKKDTDNVFLLGCYTGNKKYIGLWQDALNENVSTVGFTKKAPLSHTSSNLKTLNYLFDESEKIRGALELEKFNDVMGLLKPVHRNVRFCAKDKYASSNEIYDLSEELKKCPAAKIKELKQYAKSYQSFIGDTKNKENQLSKDTKKKLRDFYNLLHDYSHCTDNMPSREEIISLIYFESIYHNFRVFYEEDIEQAMKAMPAGTEFPQKLRFDELDELLEKIESRLSLLEGNSLFADDNQIEDLKYLANRMNKVLKYRICSPFPWVNLKHSKEELVPPESVNDEQCDYNLPAQSIFEEPF